ncbi:MAG: M14 family metallopeptidase [Bryobacterales bacterium]|nr:M14 family metallopeptidase [Bryobacteraceae bacterium]MDW8131477.1 M14 family metallopeptidase [Bryobacterales bacterium]
MRRKTIILTLFAALWAVAGAPSPREHFGFDPGDDYKLADYGQLVGYFRKLAAASDRIKVIEFGRSSMGRPMILAVISDAENLARLERYREISRRLALGEAGEEEARKLAAEGRAIVWIDSGMHATETAPSQHAPHLAFRMVTGEDEETRRIRRNVILLQIPCLNPDGLDMVAEWYRRNVGTPHENARLPWLYQKYAGHDNNRDYFMFNLEETRHAGRLLFEEWFPQIVYNQHQSPPFPARIFVPPHSEPLNPNIPAAVAEGVTLIGAAMRERFARENKPGVISYLNFDGWWNGGLRTAPLFHNMHGIMTETAGYAYATPRTYEASEFPERFANGIPTREPSIFYPRPWLGGRWTLRDAIEYMLTADFAVLDYAARHSRELLEKAWQMAREAIEAGRKGKPYAYVVPAEQWDRSSALAMLERLRRGGVRILRARSAFQAGGKSFGAGSWVLPAAQPFRAYLVDLMEPQRYPELRAGDGAARRPYDVAGWTMPLSMGVKVERIEEPFEADLEEAREPTSSAESLDYRENAAFLTLARMLERGQRIYRRATGEFTSAPAGAAWELRRPRVALYEPWTANMDTGWTQWLLDTYRVPYELVHNEDVQRGDLRRRFDLLILASQSPASILHGVRYGEAPPGSREGRGELRAVQRPEYTGGIGVRGLAALEEFTREGGWLVGFDAAAALPVEYFPLPLSNAVRPGAGGFQCPGSLLRITVDTAHPLAFGMPEETVAFVTGGQAWDVTLLEPYNRGDREVRVVARYARERLLASGWVANERQVLGKAALVEARYGRGRVVIFGFRPQFRGQTFGTFKFVLNAAYMAAARQLQGGALSE